LERSAVFPIRSFLGHTVGFVLRQTQEKRYIRYEVYSGTSIPMLWNADCAFPRIWETQHIIITEGVFDALAVKLAGAPNVVATLGANPSQLTMRWIKRLATRVTVLTDMDTAGRGAAKRYRALLPGVVVSSPQFAAHDVWDLWVSRPGALQGLVSQ
jgi:DNA primase